MMIRTVIIDDERNALEVLEMQLERYCPQVTVLATCNSGEAGIEAIARLQPDLVFLDIEMPHKNGFDVINETRNYSYNVIFTTAYDQFAIKAFRYSALDYLLKPIDINELKTAVDKITRQQQKEGRLDEKINFLLEQLQPGKRTHRIALPVGDAMQFMEPDEIIRCESDSNYTHIFLSGGRKLTLAKTLKEVEEQIGRTPFFRIHQSHLVNMNHIHRYIKGESAYVIMKDGTQLGISRNKKDAFLESFRKL